MSDDKKLEEKAEVKTDSKAPETSSGVETSEDIIKSTNKKVKIIIILSLIIVLIAAVVIGLIFYFKKNKENDIVNNFDVYDTGLFVTDTDSLTIESISDDVIGTGVLYEDSEIYTEASLKSEVVGTLKAGTTLLVYAAEGDYYLVTDADGTISGYVLKTKVNTGGIDLGNPDAETQLVNDQTGKVVGTTSSTVNPEDFPVNSSPYFIYVEKGSHTITIFAKDSNGKYTQAVRTYLTATGRTASLTPVGNFSIKAKEAWHNWGASYSPYCSKYYGGLFFHGPLYREKNFGTLYESSVTAIGTNASSGCLRTSVNAAYFIYAFCPVGTNVKIVNGSPLGRSAGKPSVSSQYIDPATNTVPVAGVSFDFSTKNITVGESLTVTAQITPSSATNKLCIWTSSNKNIVTLSGSENTCKITAKNVGTTVITATTADGSYKATFTVKVVEATTTSTTVSTTSSVNTSEPSTSESETTNVESETTTTSAETTEPDNTPSENSVEAD